MTRMTTEELRDAYFGAAELGQPRDKGLRAVADAAKRRVLDRLERKLNEHLEDSRGFFGISEAFEMVREMREELNRGDG